MDLSCAGGRLEELDMYAVGELDLTALALLTVYCRSSDPPGRRSCCAGG